MAADLEASGASSLVASVEGETIPVSANPQVASEGTYEALKEAAASNLRVGEEVVDLQVVGVGPEASGGIAQEALEDAEVVAWAASCPWSVAAEGPVVVAAACPGVACQEARASQGVVEVATTFLLPALRAAGSRVSRRTAGEVCQPARAGSGPQGDVLRRCRASLPSSLS
jgi:hypothetical protein